MAIVGDSPPGTSRGCASASDWSSRAERSEATVATSGQEEYCCVVLEEYGVCLYVLLPSLTSDSTTWQSSSKQEQEAS